MSQGGQPGTEINASQVMSDAFFASCKIIDLIMSVPFLLEKKKAGYIIGKNTSTFPVEVLGRKGCLGVGLL